MNIAGATESCYAIPKVRIEDGGQYSVIVTSEAGSVVSGTALLTITELPNGPPAEDNFAKRFELFGASGVVSVNNLGATKETGEPDHAGKPGGSSVWYNWRAPAKGIATFRTSGSSFDTLLAAYSGRSVDSLLLLDSDEDRGGYLASEVHFNTQADALYQVAIDGYANSQGNFVLSWNFQATAEELPTITAQPKSQTVAKGAAALLQVVATGQDLNYQWSLNGAPLAGAVSSSLSIPQVRPADVGSWRDWDSGVDRVEGRAASTAPRTLSGSWFAIKVYAPSSLSLVRANEQKLQWKAHTLVGLMCRFLLK